VSPSSAGRVTDATAGAACVVLPSRGVCGSATALQAEHNALYSALVEAEDRGDTQVLARLSWVLFAEVSMVRQANQEAVSALAELRAATRAAVADNSSPASLAILRHVLAGRGWVPPPHASPLQMLAAPSWGSWTRRFTLE
jgi:hypothetical protein